MMQHHYMTSENSAKCDDVTDSTGLFHFMQTVVGSTV